MKIFKKIDILIILTLIFSFYSCKTTYNGLYYTENSFYKNILIKNDSIYYKNCYFDIVCKGIITKNNSNFYTIKWNKNIYEDSISFQLIYGNEKCGCLDTIYLLKKKFEFRNEIYKKCIYNKKKLCNLFKH